MTTGYNILCCSYLGEAYYNRGVGKLGLGQKDSGCLDLSKASKLGCSKAYEAIKKYCN